LGGLCGYLVAENEPAFQKRLFQNSYFLQNISLAYWDLCGKNISKLKKAIQVHTLTKGH